MTWEQWGGLYPSETPIYDALYNLLMPPLPPTDAYKRMMSLRPGGLNSPLIRDWGKP